MITTSTIYALSSGVLPAGVGVVRVSGPKVGDLIPLLTGRPTLAPRLATLCPIRDADGDTIDHALCLHFPAPYSFTGEDVLELQIHGSRAVLAALYAHLNLIDGVVPAEPGEFTMRAFLNGRIDLTAAEGLSDLIVAETESQRKLALRNADGAQRTLYEGWRRDLLAIWGRVEADIDFSDQDDVPPECGASLRGSIQALNDEIVEHLEGHRVAEIVNEGFHVVISGPPNSGKSSLINYLAKRDISIVTDIPGTTRDLIDVRLQIKGHLVRVTDTAGLRQTDDPVERIGVERAQAVSAIADLTLYLDDGSGDPRDVDGVHVVCVSSKVDLRPAMPGGLAISTLTGAGIDDLLDLIAEAIDARLSVYDTIPSKERQLAHLHQAAVALQRSQAPVEPEFLAEHLRQAAQSLGRLTGMVDVEELLGDIFAKFCIGK